MKDINITLGQHKSAKRVISKLTAKNINISPWGKGLLEKTNFSKKKEEITLVIVLAAELGIAEETYTTQEIYEAAEKQGLSLCPAEVGPQLRLQYTDQPKYEWLNVAMEPVRDSVGDLVLFDLERDDDGLWLRGGYGRPDYQWDASYRWVFVRKSAALTLEPFGDSDLLPALATAKSKMDKIVTEIEELAAEMSLIATNSDQWWKERQQSLCQHPNVETEEVTEDYNDTSSHSGHGQKTHTIRRCKDCGLIL